MNSKIESIVSTSVENNQETIQTIGVSNYITIEEHTEALNNLINLNGVNSMIIALILIKLIISSCCKAILKTKSINVKSLYFYDVVSFAALLLMVLNSATLASTISTSTLMHVFETFLFGFPVIITAFELRKKRSSSQKENNKSA